MRHPHFFAICVAVAIGAGAWGLYWLPQRALEANGMTGGWGTIAQYIVPVALLSPLALWRARRARPTGLGFPLIGLLMGGGIVFYANSLLLTDVVRALMLFYLTSLWGTLFEFLFFGQRPSRSRLISIATAVAGIWLVFGRAGVVPLPDNLGDGLALLGGLMYAGGAARAQAVRPEGVFPVLFAFFLFGGLVAILQSLLLASALGPMPSLEAWLSTLPWLALLSVGFFIPTMAVVNWSPSRIGVGLFGLLILSELVVGTVSAALLTDERLGWREAMGCGLIIVAGLVEVILARGVGSRAQRHAL